MISIYPSSLAHFSAKETLTIPTIFLNHRILSYSSLFTLQIRKLQRNQVFFSQGHRILKADPRPRIPDSRSSGFNVQKPKDSHKLPTFLALLWSLRTKCTDGWMSSKLQKGHFWSSGEMGTECSACCSSDCMLQLFPKIVSNTNLTKCFILKRQKQNRQKKWKAYYVMFRKEE